MKQPLTPEEKNFKSLAKRHKIDAEACVIIVDDSNPIFDHVMHNPVCPFGSEEEMADWTRDMRAWPRNWWDCEKLAVILLPDEPSSTGEMAVGTHAMKAWMAIHQGKGEVLPMHTFALDEKGRFVEIEERRSEC